MYKIGFIGNSCTGKTTAMFHLIKVLKEKREKVGYCFSNCRFITFDPNMLDKFPEARLHVLWKQLAQETEQEVREDIEFLLTERTALDWFIYYTWTCKNTGVLPSEKLAVFIDEYMASYDLIYFMDSMSMDYVNDGFRPATTKIRDEVNPDYLKVPEYLSKITEVVRITDPEVSLRCDTVAEHFKGWMSDRKIILPEGLACSQ